MNPPVCNTTIWAVKKELDEVRKDIEAWQNLVKHYRARVEEAESKLLFWQRGWGDLNCENLQLLKRLGVYRRKELKRQARHRLEHSQSARAAYVSWVNWNWAVTSIDVQRTARRISWHTSDGIERRFKEQLRTCVVPANLP